MLKLILLGLFIDLLARFILWQLRQFIIDVAIFIRDITGKDATIGNLTICAKD